MNKPVFAGLVFDEMGRPLETTYVGNEPCYVLDAAGFRRHIPSEYVDRQVLRHMKEQLSGHEDLIAEQTAKMLGQEDLFSMALIVNQLKNIDEHLEALLQTGIPEEARSYLGMMGMRITVDIHGDVVNIEQPGLPIEGDE